MVFYRKYRPQNIQELDLGSVRERLYAMLRGDLPHALLFSGPKGLGKTSAARIVAKAINCEKRNQESGIRNQGRKKKEKVHDSPFIIHDSTNIEPCNRCDVCISITNGSNIDVLEIDAASNRGIDEIRDLREKIKFSPSNLPKKVYIIDEVHMLTTEAFNALLKTLEEPPNHAMFILCTTEPWKLPATIISRTVQIQFELPSKDDILRSLQKIITGEKLSVEDGVLEEISALSEGSFRDAHKILEEINVVSRKNKITKNLFDALFHTKTIEIQVDYLIDNLFKKNAKESLRVIESLAKIGVDFRLVNQKIVEELRDLLLKKTIDGGAEKLEASIESITTLLEYFNESYKGLKFAVLPQLPLELAIIEWCIIDKAQSFDFAQDKSSKLKAQNDKNQISLRSDLKEKNQDVTRSDLDIGTKSKAIKPPQATDDFLKQLITLVKKDNHSIAGILRGCHLVSAQDGKVELEASYKFHKDKLSEQKTREIIEKRASEILGKEVKVSIEMKK